MRQTYTATKTPEFTHVLYHANCPDGFGAAWAAWLVLGDSAVYLPVKYGDPPPELPQSARVAILDFSYPREVLLTLARVARIIVLDHHKTAEAALEGLSFASFDINKSGARMAWERFHPGKPLPDLLEYIEDRDLWRWRMHGSKEVSVALHSYPFDFETWSSFVKPMAITMLRQEGKAILRYQEQGIERILKHAHTVCLISPTGRAYKVTAVNSPIHQSEIGNLLASRDPEVPWAGVYYATEDGKIAWSLRSVGEFDVSAIAKEFGGGGHRNAAGFAVLGGLS